MAVLLVRAWRDSRLHPASENSGPRKRDFCFGRGRVELVSLWESVRRSCALILRVRGDTVVQYAAYLTSSSLWAKEGTVSFDSDYSGEAGRSPFFLQRKFCCALQSFYCFWDTTNESRMLNTHTPNLVTIYPQPSQFFQCQAASSCESALTLLPSPLPPPLS